MFTSNFATEVVTDWPEIRKRSRHPGFIYVTERVDGQGDPAGRPTPPPPSPPRSTASSSAPTSPSAGQRRHPWPADRPSRLLESRRRLCLAGHANFRSMETEHAGLFTFPHMPSTSTSTKNSASSPLSNGNHVQADRATLFGRELPQTYSALNKPQQAESLKAGRDLTNQIYAGLDLHRDSGRCSPAPRRNRLTPRRFRPHRLRHLPLRPRHRSRREFLLRQIRRRPPRPRSRKFRPPHRLLRIPAMQKGLKIPGSRHQPCRRRARRPRNAARRASTNPRLRDRHAPPRRERLQPGRMSM